MKKTVKFLSKACIRLFSLIMVAAMLFSLIFATLALGPTDGTVERLNVMIVIDGSASLRRSTDKNNLRYEAIDLFLALLTNEGNNVGAIVFNHDIMLETECLELKGKAEKMALSQQIRDAGSKGDTDIGGALLAAVEKAVTKSQENNMDSVIILFSDGRTDVPGGQEAMDLSLENKRVATEMAQNNGIPVYSICLNASSVASPEELMEISNQTSGTFVEVNNPEDLTSAFETFYNLIFPNTCNKLTQTTFSGEGTLSTDIAIPAYGAEEVNIILNTTNVDDIRVSSPNGSLTPAEIEETTMSGGYYDVIKLVDPQNGKWQVDLSGKPGTEVTINVLYNIDSTVDLSLSNGQTDYSVGDGATFTAKLLSQGSVITDNTIVREYTAKLHLKNLTSGVEKSFDMVPGVDGSFTYTLEGNDYCSWSAYAELIYSNIVLSSNEVFVNFGNTAPVVNPDYSEVDISVSLFSDKNYTLNAADFFSDAQDGKLSSYKMVSSQLIPGTASLNESSGELKVNVAKSKSGIVVIEGYDSQGAMAQLTVKFNVTNYTPVIITTGSIIILAIIVVIIIALTLYLTRPWKGRLTVYSLDKSQNQTQFNIRGKLPLKRLGLYGLSVDGDFVVAGKNRLEFRSKKPIFADDNGLDSFGSKKNSKRLVLMEGDNFIYSNEQRTNGIIVEIICDNYSF